MNPDVIKIQSHTGIAAAVPYLLGFIPTDSLVVIGLEGPRDRMSFTMRIDLPDPDEEAIVIDGVARRMCDFDRAIVVVFTDEGLDRGPLPRGALIERLLAGLEVREALLVHGDRVWSYLCDNPDCCPPEGRTYLDGVDATNVAAAYVLHGRSVLMTRQQVVDCVAPMPGACAEVLAALPAVRAEVSAWSSEKRVGALGRLLAVSLARLDDPRAELTADEVAQFVALLDDVDVRDSFMRRLALTEDETWRRLVAELARKTPPGQDAEVCCALALRAYLDGDGVLTQAGLDRALASGSHTLAVMLRMMLDQGVHPDGIRQIFDCPADYKSEPWLL